jgi:hypothetical protein
MKILQYAKSKEELLSAPINIRNAMDDFLNYSESAGELKNDIFERFNYPSLWTAIDKLVEYTELTTIAYIEMQQAGYTINDALMYGKYEDEAVTD